MSGNLGESHSAPQSSSAQAKERFRSIERKKTDLVGVEKEIAYRGKLEKKGVGGECAAKFRESATGTVGHSPKVGPACSAMPLQGPVFLSLKGAPRKKDTFLWPPGGPQKTARSR